MKTTILIVLLCVYAVAQDPVHAPPTSLGNTQNIVTGPPSTVTGPSTATSGAAAADPLATCAAASTLTMCDVQSVIQNAIQSVNVGTLVVAVTDRQGDILGVYRQAGAPSTAVGNLGVSVDSNELAVALARTTSFFSNDQAPLSSRTVRFISGIHFPNGVKFTSSGPLYAIENTNRGCSFNTNYLPGQALPPATLINGTSPGLGIITGKADMLDSNPYAVNPGGVPLFKNGILVGGVGVTGATYDITEYAGVVGSYGAGLGAAPAPPGVVIVGGISLPFVNQKTQPTGTAPGPFTGSYVVGPVASPGPDPQGDLITETAGKNGLTLSDVQGIVNAAITNANLTRAVIRLPDGARARFIIAISDLDGTLLALNRMPDATIFSADVAVAKARNVIYFTTHPGLTGVPTGTAVTNRTIGYGSQPLFPIGIDGTQPGPFFNVYQYDTAHACTQGPPLPGPGSNGTTFNPANQNGIVFFPGSVPLYKNGVLVGGLGISGDGVDQDDYVTGQAMAGFEAPLSIQAGQVVIRNVRLPYLSFPRDPTF